MPDNNATQMDSKEYFLIIWNDKIMMISGFLQGKAKSRSHTQTAANIDGLPVGFNDMFYYGQA